MSLERLCSLAGVSISGYYAWKHRPPSRRQLDDMIVLAHIRNQFALSRQTYGSPRIHVELCEEGISVGRHRTARLMRENNLKAGQKTRSKGRRTAVTASLSLPICWIRTLPARVQIRNGVLTSVIYGRLKAGCILLLWLTFIPVALLDGKRVTG